MKHVFTLVCLTLLSLFGNVAFAQEKGGRVQAIKVSYLSDRLHLTSDQAEKFWPAYNRCADEKRRLRSAYGEPSGRASQDAEQAMRYLDDNMEYRKKEVQLQQRCNDEYLRFLSPQQVATLVDAERDFRQMLLDQLKNRKN